MECRFSREGPIERRKCCGESVARRKTEKYSELNFEKNKFSTNRKGGEGVIGLLAKDNLASDNLDLLRILKVEAFHPFPAINCLIHSIKDLRVERYCEDING